MMAACWPARLLSPCDFASVQTGWLAWRFDVRECRSLTLDRLPSRAVPALADALGGSCLTELELNEHASVDDVSPLAVALIDHRRPQLHELRLHTCLSDDGALNFSTVCDAQRQLKSLSLGHCAWSARAIGLFTRCVAEHPTLVAATATGAQAILDAALETARARRERALRLTSANGIPAAAAANATWESEVANWAGIALQQLFRRAATAEEPIAQTAAAAWQPIAQHAVMCLVMCLVWLLRRVVARWASGSGLRKCRAGTGAAEVQKMAAAAVSAAEAAEPSPIPPPRRCHRPLTPTSGETTSSGEASSPPYDLDPDEAPVSKAEPPSPSGRPPPPPRVRSHATAPTPPPRASPLTSRSFPAPPPMRRASLSPAARAAPFHTFALDDAGPASSDLPGEPEYLGPLLNSPSL